MPRSNFNNVWANNAAQFERPEDPLISRGWAGGASEDPPEAKWENWWHNRVDAGLQQIERQSAMDWDPDTVYSIGGVAKGSDGRFYLSVSATNSGNNPTSDNGSNWEHDAGPGSNVMVFSASNSTLWSIPSALKSGLRKAFVQVIGGGGGGAKDNDNGAGGGGGQGGEAFGIFDLKGVNSITITVGAGGLGGSLGAGQLSGYNGGRTSFGNYMYANGGRGGLTASGADGGTSSGGYLNRAGAPGGPGMRLPDAKFSGSGGGQGGGPSIYGPIDANTTGNNGISPGAGGSGSIGTSGGGSGATGICIVRW